MNVQNFFKNIRKKYTKKNIMKLITDLSMDGFFNIPDYDENISYKRGEIVLYYTEPIKKYIVMRAKEDIEAGSLDSDMWETLSNPELEETFLKSFKIAKKTYKYTTTEDNETSITIPKTDFNKNSESILLTLNTSIVTSDKYTIRDDNTIQLTHDSLLNLVKGTEFGIICLYSDSKIPIGNTKIVEVNLTYAIPYTHFIRKDEIDKASGTTTIRLPKTMYNRDIDNIQIFANGLLQNEHKNYSMNENLISFKYLLKEDDIVSCVVLKDIVQYLTSGKSPDVATPEMALSGTDDSTIMTPNLTKTIVDNIQAPTIATKEEVLSGEINNKTITPSTLEAAVRQSIIDWHSLSELERKKIRIYGSDYDVV